MGIFTVDDRTLKALYKRAYIEAKGNFVDVRKYPYLDNAIEQYCRENKCSRDYAIRIAKTL